MNNARHWKRARSLFLPLFSFVSACSDPASNSTDRESVVRAILAAEAARRPPSHGLPCIQAQFKKRHEEAAERAADVPAHALPPPFAFCRGSTRGSFIVLSEPEIEAEQAFINIDLRCGDMCGAGTGYNLERVRGHWKVIHSATTWVG
jgi:hypothetical protein